MDRFIYIFKKRIDLKNKNRLIIQTGSCEKYMKDVRTVSYINGEEKEMSVEENKNTSMLFVYKNAEPEFDSEYNFSLELPDKVKNVKIIFLKDTYPSGRIEVNITGAQIELLRKNIEINLVTAVAVDGKIKVTGWTESGHEADIEVYAHNSRLEFGIDRFKRADIVGRYPDGEIYEKCGFELTIPVNGREISKLKLIADDEGRKGSVTIGINSHEEKDRTESRKKLAMSDRTSYVTRAVNYIAAYGMKKFVRKAYDKLTRQAERKSNNYFLSTNADAERLAKQREYFFSHRPKFSIVIPIYRPKKEFFIKMLESVEAQTYDNWELCLADGGEECGVGDIVREFVSRCGKEKVKYCKLEKNLNIAGNTNAAMEMATGEYIVFGDHDDELHPTALFECMRVIQDNPDVDFIYTDEDKIIGDTQRHSQGHFKSDFNLELLRHSNYICHLVVVKKSLTDKVGELNGEYDGAQDYDYVLRCIEAAQMIHHIPRILYHWRISSNSTAKKHSSKNYANDAGRRAVRAHFERLGIEAEVNDAFVPGYYNIRYKSEQPLISVIIPNKDHAKDLRKCIASLKNISTYTNYELIIVENNSVEKETFEEYEKLRKEFGEKIQIVYWKDKFNYSAINNFGVGYAKGEYLLLLNNDTEIITSHAIDRMISHFTYDNVGIVGAKLLYNDETIQHAGIVLGYQGVAGHAFLGLDDTKYGYFGRAMTAQEVSAVTAACLLTKKSVYDKVGGLDESFEVAFNDIDYCMKVRQAGYKIIYEPDAKLHHYESKSRGTEDTAKKQERFYGEVMRFINKWRPALKKGDPYYNPNLELVGTLYEIKK